MRELSTDGSRTGGHPGDRSPEPSGGGSHSGSETGRWRKSGGSSGSETRDGAGQRGLPLLLLLPALSGTQGGKAGVWGWGWGAMGTNQDPSCLGKPLNTPSR